MGKGEMTSPNRQMGDQRKEACGKYRKEASSVVQLDFSKRHIHMPPQLARLSFIVFILIVQDSPWQQPSACLSACSGPHWVLDTWLEVNWDCHFRDSFKSKPERLSWPPMWSGMSGTRGTHPFKGSGSFYAYTKTQIMTLPLKAHASKCFKGIPLLVARTTLPTSQPPVGGVGHSLSQAQGTRLRSERWTGQMCSQTDEGHTISASPYTQ